MTYYNINGTITTTAQQQLNELLLQDPQFYEHIIHQHIIVNLQKFDQLTLFQRQLRHTTIFHSTYLQHSNTTIKTATAPPFTTIKITTNTYQHINPFNFNT